MRHRYITSYNVNMLHATEQFHYKSIINSLATYENVFKPYTNHFSIKPFSEEMKKLLSVTSLLHMTAIVLCAPSPSPKETHKNSTTTYDQRQVGKYNIHFNIKDVAIIALSSEDIVDHIGVRKAEEIF